MYLNLSNNSIANYSDEVAKTLKHGKLVLSIDVLVVCLFYLGAIVPTLGIVGNSAVLIIIKRNRAFQTAQNYLLGSLAAADITNLLFCAFSVIPLVTVLPDGVIGTVLCRFFVGFNVPLTATVVSVFTLTVLAVERYHAIVKPMQMLQLTRETYSASIVLNAPIFVYTDYKFKKAF